MLFCVRGRFFRPAGLFSGKIRVYWKQSAGGFCAAPANRVRLFCNEPAAGEKEWTRMKTGLIMEGGAMRGMFTAGVLDVLMENGLVTDGAIGV